MGSGFAITAKFGVDAKGVQTGVNAATKHVKRATKEIESMGSRIKSGFEKAGGKISGLGKAALGAAAGFYALDSATGFAKSVISLGGDIQDQADRLNMTTDSVQGLAFAFSQSGANAATFEKGMVALNQKMEAAREGSSEARASLRGMGLTLADIKNLTPEEALMKIADYAKNAVDPVQELAAVTELFGKAGKLMNAPLKQGSEELKRIAAAAPKMAQSTIKSLDAVGDKADENTKKLKILGAELGVKLAKKVGLIPEDDPAGDAGGTAGEAGAGGPGSNRMSRRRKGPLDRADPVPFTSKEIQSRRDRMGSTAEQRRQKRAKDRAEARITGENRSGGQATNTSFMDDARTRLDARRAAENAKPSSRNAADSIGDATKLAGAVVTRDGVVAGKNNRKAALGAGDLVGDVTNGAAIGGGAGADIPTPGEQVIGGLGEAIAKMTLPQGIEASPALEGIQKTLDTIAGYLSKGGPIVMK